MGIMSVGMDATATARLSPDGNARAGQLHARTNALKYVEMDSTLGITAAMMVIIRAVMDALTLAMSNLDIHAQAMCAPPSAVME